MGQTEVTQGEWESVMGSNPSGRAGPSRPVEKVSWLDAVAYCNARSSVEGLTPAYTINGSDVTWDRKANGYRLPTESEWEVACRAGSGEAFTNGPITQTECSPLDPNLDRVGWYCGNADHQTHDVKGKDANGWGLYDMHGNVWEWCWDWYNSTYPQGTQGDPVEDPAGPGSGSRRVVRGGSWSLCAKLCRSADRGFLTPGVRAGNGGFRLARTAD